MVEVKVNFYCGTTNEPPSHLRGQKRDISVQQQKKGSARRFVMLIVILQKEYRILLRACEKFSYVGRNGGSGRNWRL
jgi:hypothetical protein